MNNLLGSFHRGLHVASSGFLGRRSIIAASLDRIRRDAVGRRSSGIPSIERQAPERIPFLNNNKDPCRKRPGAGPNWFEQVHGCSSFAFKDLGNPWDD